MTRQHDRSRFGISYTAVALVRSAWFAAQQPMPTPRHARHDTTRSARCAPTR